MERITKRLIQKTSRNVLCAVIVVSVFGCGVTLEEASKLAAQDSTLQRMAVQISGSDGGYIGAPGGPTSDTGTIPPPTAPCSGIELSGTLAKLHFGYTQENHPIEPDGHYHSFGLVNVTLHGSSNRKFPMGVASVPLCTDRLCPEGRVQIAPEVRLTLSHALEGQRANGKRQPLPPQNVKICASYVQELPAGQVLWVLDLKSIR